MAATILDILAQNAAPDGPYASLPAVRCGSETWTHQDFDRITTGLATSIGSVTGSRPTVVVISENHPYILAILFAVWKLGGIFAPLDPNAPETLLRGMLHNLRPDLVVLPEVANTTKSIVESLNLPMLSFSSDTTMTTLSNEFPFSELPQPLRVELRHEDVALYIHTSSATTIHNLKCVPLTQKSVISNGRFQDDWFRRTFPDQNPLHHRVLGWSPWTHIIGIWHDLVACMVLSKGCYVFGAIPSLYPVTTSVIGSKLAQASASRPELASSILDMFLRDRPNVFCGVPWVLEELIRALGREEDQAKKDAILDVFRSFRYFSTAGAKTSEQCIDWANSAGLKLVLTFGMTEFGGAIFHSLATDKEPGWILADTLFQDAEFVLDVEEGEQEGELYVSSDYFATGYLEHPDTGRLFKTENGRTTFRTGDIYSWHGPNQDRLIWKGRKEDFIAMSSGEILDPRPGEASINECPGVATSCIIGNRFVKEASQSIFLIIEPKERPTPEFHGNITKAVANLNKTLPAPLRIPWARVIILDLGKPMRVPFSKKGVILRKRLEEVFSDLVHGASVGKVNGIVKVEPVWKDVRDVEDIVIQILAESLGITRAMLLDNKDSTFAEFGMTSLISTQIVNNLNKRFELDLPLNTCHIHVDLSQLLPVIFEALGFLVELEDVETSKSSSSWARSAGDDIVVVGQALRLPGGIKTPDAFWRVLMEQRTDIPQPIPASRWDHASFYRSPTSKEVKDGDITFERAGFIDIEEFDNGFFGITAPEAKQVSPSIRLVLESAFEALENANIPISQIKGTDAGVYVALMDDGYTHLAFEEKSFEMYNRYYGTGGSHSTACGRLSYLLDLHGPSMTLDTACSAGLVAVHSAVQHLRSGLGETAIVCAANCHTWPGSFGFVSAQEMTSKNSRCATFTNAADGYSPSEGVVSLILKTRSAAERDGNTILGVIKRTESQHNGRTQGMVAPSTRAQSVLHRTVIQRAGLTPSDIDFVETHGTGTILGDAMEIQGLNNVFANSHTPSRPLVVGAAKSCIGHTETAAGLVGLVKGLLTLSKGIVPGLAHLTPDNLNKDINTSVVPMNIPHQPAYLSAREAYRGLVLAYGFAGSIAGAVIESVPKKEPAPQLEDRPLLFVVSAKTPNALRDYISSYISFCTNADPSDFAAICYTSCVGREHYRYRFACVATDMDGLLEELHTRLRSLSKEDVKTSKAGVVLAFPGQGSQFLGMAKELAEEFSGFHSILTSASEVAERYLDYPILDIMLGTSKGKACTRKIDESQVAQVAIFLFQYAFSTWLRSIGVTADAVVGYSIGEIAAAVLSDILTFEDALKFVIARGGLLSPRPGHEGAMAAVASPGERVQQLIERLGMQDDVVIAVHNTLQTCVVGGKAESVVQLVATVKAEGTRAVKLNVDQGFHSPTIAPAIPELRSWVEKHLAQSKSPSIPFFSSLLGGLHSSKEPLATDYWVDHARSPVQFAQAVSQFTQLSALRVLIDIGPQRSIWAVSSSLSLPSGMTAIAPCNKAGKSQLSSFLESLAVLFEQNLDLDFITLFGQTSYQIDKINLPTYPYQRQRFYPNLIPSRSKPRAIVDKAASATREEQLPITNAFKDFLTDHQIEGIRVAPGATFARFMALIPSNPTKSVESIQFHRPLVVESGAIRVSAHVEQDGSFAISQEGSETKVASGTLRTSARPYPFKVYRNIDPERMVERDDLYAQFTSVNFGEPFRSITGVKIWEDHADALIVPSPSSIELEHDHDQIRKLDACIHMFGTVRVLLSETFEEYEQLLGPGAYLPSSLEGYTMYADSFPDEFICRYHLPIEITRNAQVLSVRFEVLSTDGKELLASCDKYSVAWIPKGTVIQTDVPAAAAGAKREENKTKTEWFHQEWIEAPLSSGSKNKAVSGTLLHIISDDSATALPEELAQSASHVVTLNLATPSTFLSSLSKDTELSVVIDILPSTPPDFESPVFATQWQSMLSIIQSLIAGRYTIKRMLLVTSNTSPFDNSDSAVDNVFSATLSSIIQGLFRVYIRETGLQGPKTLTLDLPSDLAEEDRRRIVASELESLGTEAADGTVDLNVAYRSKAGGLARFVPQFAAVQDEEGLSVSASQGGEGGVALIVGMGSIGAAMAKDLLSSGMNVVFVGRRAEDDSEIQSDLIPLRSVHPSASVHYLRGDATSLSSLRQVFTALHSLELGPVKTIVHAAAVVEDATLTVATPDQFERVLRPKVLGAWNLHLLAQELVGLEQFVVLSSISVPFGNPGQAAYVSANSFLESLVSFRRARGLPGIALELGAWQSKLLDAKHTDSTDPLIFPVKNEDGVPLIIKALDNAKRGSGVDLIAHLNPSSMRKRYAISSNALFKNILQVGVPGQEAEQTTKLTKEVIEKCIIQSLRVVLELGKDEPLDVEESLTSCGVDSISFAQARGKVNRELGIEVPTIYLAETYTIRDMLEGVCQSVGAN